MGMTPEQVLSTIPGWEGAAVTELNGGLSNRTRRVDKNGRSAVLKIDERPRGEPYNTRRQEAQVQSRAFEAGLATRVLFVNETAYMTEYVAGTVWSPDCLDDDSNIEQLAIALRKLHSLPLTGRVFDAAGAARDYARRIVDVDERMVRTACGESRRRRCHPTCASATTTWSCRTLSTRRRRVFSTGNMPAITTRFSTWRLSSLTTACRQRSATSCLTSISMAMDPAGASSSSARRSCTSRCFTFGNRLEGIGAKAPPTRSCGAP